MISFDTTYYVEIYVCCATYIRTSMSYSDMSCMKVSFRVRHKIVTFSVGILKAL